MIQSPQSTQGVVAPLGSMPEAVPGSCARARILDLGCGTGTLPLRAEINAADQIVGVDLNARALAIARQRFPNRLFYVAAAECLPFPDKSFDRVVSGVALPYMNIPRVLAEVHRVLAPGGSVFFSLHPLRFTLAELSRALPRIVPSLFRLFVIVNGTVMHLTGKNLTLQGRNESFQTQRGMRRLLRRAGFEQIEFTRPEGRLLVRAITRRDVSVRV